MKIVKKILAVFVLGAMMLPISAFACLTTDQTEICGYPVAPSSESQDYAVKADLDTSNICGLPLGPYTNSSLDALIVPHIEEPSARAGYIQVKVNSPCDVQWRNAFPDTWMAEANTAVEIADDQLSEWFDIDFQSVAQNTWTSPNNDYEDILDSAIDDVGLKSGAQIMIAFSGRDANVGGAAYLNSRYCVVFDQGTEYNGYVIRHEVGHLYGCPDEYNTETGEFTSKECLMNNCYVYSDTICSSCYSIWDGNKNDK